MGRRSMRKSSGRSDGARADFITTHAKGFHPAWTARVQLLPGFHEDFLRCRPGTMSWLRSLKWAWRLFRASRGYRGVITGSEHTGHMFALMQRLFRTRQRWVPHVMVDFPWAATPGPLWLTFKRLQMQLEAPALTAVMAHGSPEEAKRFTSAFGVLAGKFIFQPYHHTLHGSEYQLSQGDYVFSGGDGGGSRDYATLVRAVDGLGVRTIICARGRDYFRGLTIPPHVEIRTVDSKEFDQLMAGAAVVVVPVPCGTIHTGGHTVIVNAMAMGKPVIIAASDEYRAYVQDGATGVLVPSGDVDGLRSALQWILADRTFARRLGRKARQVAEASYQPEAFFDRVFTLLDGAARPAEERDRPPAPHSPAPPCGRIVERQAAGAPPGRSEGQPSIPTFRRQEGENCQ